jgi:membrane-associated HD superfamily phosphohydrolase
MESAKSRQQRPSVRLVHHGGIHHRGKNFHHPAEAWFLGLPLSRPVSAVGFGIPLAAGAMIVCLFMGRETALIFALAWPVRIHAAPGGLETFIYFILSCTMAAWWLQDCRERKIIIKTGAKLGLLNAFLAVVINVYLGTASWPPFPLT